MITSHCSYLFLYRTISPCINDVEVCHVKWEVFRGVMRLFLVVALTGFGKFIGNIFVKHDPQRAAFWITDVVMKKWKCPSHFVWSRDAVLNTPETKNYSFL